MYLEAAEDTWILAIVSGCLFFSAMLAIIEVVAVYIDRFDYIKKKGEVALVSSNALYYNYMIKYDGKVVKYPTFFRIKEGKRDIYISPDGKGIGLGKAEFKDVIVTSVFCSIALCVSCLVLCGYFGVGPMNSWFNGKL